MLIYKIVVWFPLLLLKKVAISVAHLHFFLCWKLQLNSQTIYGATRHLYMRVKLMPHNYISFFIRASGEREKTLSTFFIIIQSTSNCNLRRNAKNFLHFASLMGSFLAFVAFKNFFFNVALFMTVMSDQKMNFQVRVMKM